MSSRSADDSFSHNTLRGRLSQPIYIHESQRPLDHGGFILGGSKMFLDEGTPVIVTHNREWHVRGIWKLVSVTLATDVNVTGWALMTDEEMDAIA